MTGSPFCCSWLREKATVDCGHHTSPWDCPDVMVVWSERGEFGLPVRDGGESFIVISHCPWCGTRLPADDTVDVDTCSTCGCELSGSGECWWCESSVDGGQGS